MKRLLITLSIVTLSVVGFYFYNTSSFKLVRNVFKQIDNGDFRYREVGLNTVLVYPMDLITTDKISNFLINKNGAIYEGDFIKYESHFFEIPLKVDDYKIVSEMKYTDTIKTYWSGVQINPAAQFWNIKCKVNTGLSTEFYTLIFIKQGRNYLLASMLKN